MKSTYLDSQVANKITQGDKSFQEITLEAITDALFYILGFGPRRLWPRVEVLRLKDFNSNKKYIGYERRSLGF